MAEIRSFRAIRPTDGELARRIAALPYDVYSRQEAKEVIRKEPLSFLRIDRAETAFADEVDTYADCVYEKARELLEEMLDRDELRMEDKPCYYIYELCRNGRVQTGIAACASVDDYQSGVIKRHENTRADKEEDRIRHVDICEAQTGPIFLAYRSAPAINKVVERVKTEKALYDFCAEDGITHRIWMISDAWDCKAIADAFRHIGQIYIADGHHRCASAVKVSLKRRRENPDYTGEEEFNFFLSVLFPHDQLMIMDYNRVVKDLNMLSAQDFLKALSDVCRVEAVGTKPCAPTQKGEVSMFLEGIWYRLTFHDELLSSDPVEGLDVALLQKYVMDRILSIQDPKKDQRIDFVGGIRGLSELEARVHKDCKAAFAMYPTSIEELFAVADAGLLMPPKSTWFEPKLRSGLLIHKI